MGNDIHDDLNFKLECRDVAYCAGQIHKWLEEILRRSNAVRRAYAFKNRVKSSDDIRNKVLGYRNHEDPSRRNVNYAPASVTDASGFRIVKLFNAEVPEALDQLLALLDLPLPAAN